MNNQLDTSKYIDDILDEVNEYHLLYDYVSDFGISNKIELEFNGDFEAAKRYEQNEQASASIDFFDQIEFLEDDENTTQDHAAGDIENKPPSTDGSNISNRPFSLARYKPSQIQLTSFQLPQESRAKYLVRSLQLWQEFINSGDFERLQVLFNDILDDDCLHIYGPSMPMIGRDKILEQHKSILRYVPDFCVAYTKIVRSKKRLITIKGNSFGTFPYANAVDKTINSWNIFENASIDRLDEHHKTQNKNMIL